MQVSLTEAAASLNDLVEAAIDGEEVILLVDNRPVAKIMSLEVRKRRPAKAGSAKGQVWMSDDFDEPLPEFREYME
jgi:prevent-host-death family protein